MAKNNFSEQLVRYRKQKGLTQEALAGMLNVTPQAVSKWENGSYPDGELLPFLSKALGVSLDVLFGIRNEETVNPTTLITEAIQAMPESERAEYCMNLFYTVICACSNIQSSEFRIPEKLLRVTYAQLKSDSALSLARLNEDMQYFCYLRIPENGINSYAAISDRLMQFFRLLSRRETLRILYFFGASERNHVWSVRQIAGKLDLSEKTVADVLGELDRMGAIWSVRVDSQKDPVYCYDHSVSLEMIIVLATSFINYFQHIDPNIDTWETGAFRMPESPD